MSAAVERLERRERIARTESHWQAVKAVGLRVAGLPRVQQAAAAVGMLAAIAVPGTIETAF